MLKVLNIEKYDTNNEGVIVLKERFDEVEHAHEFIEMVYFQSCGGMHCVDGKYYRINKGDVCIIDRMATHSYIQDVEAEQKSAVVYNVLFRQNFINDKLDPDEPFIVALQRWLFGRVVTEKEEDPRFFLIKSDNKQKFLSYFDDMLIEYTNKKEGYTSVIRSLLTHLFVQMFREYVKEIEPPLDTYKTQIIGKCINYIAEHYKEQLSVKDLAKIVFVSPQYLNKLFNVYMQQSVGEYIQSIRIEEACRQLKMTDWSINTIMNNIGYADRKFFTKTFKKKMGVTPMEYRGG